MASALPWSGVPLPRDAWWVGIWTMQNQAGALNITVTTVIAGQVKPIRTTVEQPEQARYPFTDPSRAHKMTVATVIAG